jgi:MFS family permease
MTLAVSLTLIGIIFMIEARSLPLFMVSLMVLGVPHGLTFPLSVLSLSRAFKPQQRNVANSWFFSLNMLIGIILPLVSGLFIERVGFKNSFLGILAVVVVIMILMFDSFRRWKISDSRTVS